MSSQAGSNTAILSPLTPKTSNCCGHLLSALGLEIKYPEQAERLRQARTRMRRPSAAAFGLTAAR